MTKIFKMVGLPYYIKGCNNVYEASLFAIKNRWGVMPENLIEVKEIKKITAVVINKERKNK